MRALKAQSWDNILQLVTEYSRKGYVFRGVAQWDYDLVPKIGRPDIRLGGYSKKAEKAIFERFKLESVPHTRHQLRYESDWLVLAQHHGLPTRLLDWSESPLVALYFALASSLDIDESAAVYALNKNDFQAITGTDTPFEEPGLKIVYPPHVSERITAQKGIFTIHQDPTIKLSNNSVIKIGIVKDLKMEAFDNLSMLGINAYSTFPDIDGLCQSLSIRYKYSS